MRSVEHHVCTKQLVQGLDLVLALVLGHCKLAPSLPDKKTWTDHRFRMHSPFHRRAGTRSVERHAYTKQLVQGLDPGMGLAHCKLAP